jgi:hypothetical protein
VKLLGRRADDADDAEGSPEPEPIPGPAPATPTGTTAPKGRPTPKRNERNKPRGPVAPAPATAAEARQRRKQARESMTKEERKAAKAASRAAVAEQRARVRAGDESALSVYDKGPVRGYVRDIVDSRRNLLGLLMPAALLLIMPTLFAPRLQVLASPVMLLLMIAMIVDGFLLARKVNRAVDAQFPGHAETRGKLGLYAVSRATQLRRSRTPAPRVERGAKVV